MIGNSDVSHCTCGNFAKISPTTCERPRRVLVVGVDQRHHLAARPGKALVQGVEVAVVFLADPVGEAVGVFADDVDAAVGGAAVDDGVFEIRDKPWSRTERIASSR